MEIALLLLLVAERRRRVHRAVPSELPSLTVTLIIKQASVGVIPVRADFMLTCSIVYDTTVIIAGAADDRNVIDRAAMIRTFNRAPVIYFRFGFF